MRSEPRRCALALAAAALVLALTPADAAAIPAFARKYGVSCSLCHAPAPRLNAFGERFAGNGFEMAPGEEPRDTIDTGDELLRLLRQVNFAFRVDLYAAASTRSPSGGAAVDLETPWGIKLLSGGPLADRVSYYLYFFLTERGEVAGLEDAYLQFTDLGGTGVSVIAGQFQVSDPLFKRELRLEYEDYQPYRVRVGEARADLTYDRWLFATWSPWSGGDLAVQVVNGRGLDAASGLRLYDRDDHKNLMLRLSQEVGPVRVGGFGYLGWEREEGATDRIRIWGPDATVPVGGGAELNLQYLRRTDSDPFFAGAARERATVDAAFAELVWGPQGPNGRLWLTGLVNWIDADRPVVSLRLGEQEGAERFLERYLTAAVGASWLHRRNVRFLGEAGWDFEREAARLTTGVVTAF